MQRWEYLSVYFEHDPKEGTWACTFKERGKVVGIDGILAYPGEYGWELVNFLPAYSRYTGTINPENSFNTDIVEGYTAIFKRPKQ